MSALPTRAYLIDAARTGGEMKTALGDQRDFIAQGAGGAAESTLTLATDACTPTTGVHTIDTEAAAATDNLKNLLQTTLQDGQLLLIRCANAARVITVKHSAGGAGQISLKAGVDFVLDSTSKWLLLKRTGALWEELAHFTLVDDRKPVLAKTGAYSLVAQDLGKVIDATSGTWSLSLLAAATAGDGFWFAVKVGSGTITIDPNGAELIDGAATLALAPGDEAIVVCTGAAWRTIGRYIAASFPLTVPCADDTERTTTSTTYAALSSFSGLSIPNSKTLRITGNWRKTAGFAATADLAISLNGTRIIFNALFSIASNTNQAEHGSFEAIFPPRTSASYQNGGIFLSTNAASTPRNGVNSWTSGNIPTTTLTDITVDGQVGNAAITLAIDNVRVSAQD